MRLTMERKSQKRGLIALAALACWLLTDAPKAQARPTEQVAAHRKTLLGPDPAPPGHRDRRIALTALVEMNGDEAHAVLADVLEGFPDVKRVPVGTVLMLLELLSTRAALDLGKLSDPRKKVEVARRVAIYSAHVPGLVRLFTVATQGKVPAEQRAALVGELELFFKTLPGAVRRPTLNKLFGTRGPLQVGALRLAGATEDPQMSPDLAPLLADAKLRPIVQDALRSLTFRPHAFRDAADFAAWWKQNSAKSYRELVRDAALHGAKIVKQLEQEFAAKRARDLERLVLRSERVIGLALQAQPPRWKLVRAELADPVLAGHSGHLLEAFYRGLRAAEPDPKELQRTLGELAELRAWLGARYRSAMATHLSASLSAWAIASKLLGGPAAEETQKKLLELLSQERGSASPPMGRVLELLTLFPDDAVRDRVLGVLERAPAAAPFLSDGITVVGQLGLGGVGSRTITLLRRIVEAQKVPSKIRGQALDVLGRLKSPEVLGTLRDLVQAPETSKLPEQLRAAALAWVVTQAEGQLQTRANGDLEKLARETLQLLGSCIGDPSARIRLDAARALEKFPPLSTTSSFSKDFLVGVAGTIVSRAAHRLRSERDDSVVRQLRAVLIGQAQRSEVGPRALEALVLAVTAWKKATGTGASGAATAFLNVQLPAAVDDIERLLGSVGVQPATTLQLAKMLVTAGLPEIGRVVVGAEVCAQLDAAPSGSDDQERTRRAALRLERARLVIRLVEEAGDPAALPAAQRSQLDTLLISAQNGIPGLASEAPLALVRLGGALLGANRAADAARVLDGYLKEHGKDAPLPLQQRTRRALAEAWIKSGKPAAAAKLLEPQRDEVSLRLRADALLLASDYVAAEKTFAELLKSPELAKSGPQREQAQIGFATALVKQNRVAAATQYLAKLGPLSDADAKARRLVLENDLKKQPESPKAADPVDGRAKAKPPGK